MANTKIQDLTNIGAMTTGDKVVGERIDGTTVRMTFPSVYTPGGTDVPVSDGGTGRSTATAYAVVLGGTTTTNPYQSAASGSAGQLFVSQGSAAVPIWTTPTYPTTSGTSGKILQSDGTNIGYSTPTWPTSASTSGKRLKSDGTNLVMSTTTMPDSGTSGVFIRGDGTNYVESSSTIPDTYSQGDIIYASSSNTLSALAKNTNATRYLSNTGTSNSPAWAQVNLTNGVTGTLDVANGGLGNLPLFLAVMSGTQSVATSTATKIVFDTATYNPQSQFSTVNYRFTPTSAGYYFIGASLSGISQTSGNNYQLIIYKNGSSFKGLNTNTASAMPVFEQVILGLVQMNGTTDYVEIFVFQDSGSNKTFGGSAASSFFGFKAG